MSVGPAPLLIDMPVELTAGIDRNGRVAGTSIGTRENPTEVRLDYEDILAGRLVIVIHGLPTADHGALTAGTGGLRAISPTASEYAVSRGSPASPLVEEAERINGATRYAPALFSPLLLAAWRGREALALELSAAMIEAATQEDAERATAVTDYAQAVLYNGMGRYQDAVASAQRVCAGEDLGFFGWARLELVEAGARCGNRAIATEALHDLDERTGAAGSNSALGVRARSAALLHDGNVAEALYREAIERFESDRNTVHRARAQLVYGEWLRRANRRVDARDQLRAAHETFSGIAADAFAERASRELLATGETARRRTNDTRDLLTPQEAQIARLARDGLSNPEIGTHLFISPRTVQYHLRKVFQKLEITSRNQLGRIPTAEFGGV
jgi:DNA-binding CsgD family transcriptional regulator